MENNLMPQQDAWSLAKWIGGAMFTVVITLGRWFFGDIRDTLKQHDIKFADIAKSLKAGDDRFTKLEGKFDAATFQMERMADYLHAMKGASAFQDHLLRQLQKREAKGEAYD